MDKHLRWFIMTALIYLLAGTVLGVTMRFSSAAYLLRFVHVHLMLLGFMAMMIYGIGYFIIPRFNSTRLKWPGAVVAHFWLANIALWGMMISYVFGAFSGANPWNMAFILFSSAQAVGIGMFVFNLILTIAGAKDMTAAQPQPAMKDIEPIRIRGDMPVGEIIDKWPLARRILADGGLKAVEDDEHLEKIKEMGIELRMACMRHGIDLNTMINKIIKGLSGDSDGQAESMGPGPEKIEAPVNNEHIIGNVLYSFPETEDVFRRYFGEGCFDCPGQSVETLAMSASMHNIDENELVDALNEAIHPDGSS